MDIKPIRNNKDLKSTLKRIDTIIDAEKGTRDYDELEILSTLVEAYENVHFPIDPPDPVEAIKFRMEQQGLKNVDVAPLMGGKNRVSEVLLRKRPLTLRMIRNLHNTLRIPYESLCESTVSPAKQAGKGYKLLGTPSSLTVQENQEESTYSAPAKKRTRKKN